MTATTSQPRAFTGRRAALQALTESAYLEAQALAREHGSPPAALEKEKAPATDRQEPSVKFKLPGYHFGPARKGRR